MSATDKPLDKNDFEIAVFYVLFSDRESLLDLFGRTRSEAIVLFCCIMYV